MTHRLAGQTVTLINAQDPVRGMVVAGAKFCVEDSVAALLDSPVWSGVTTTNWAVANYRIRAARIDLPVDENVVYGKIGGLGHIVHESELPQ